MFIRKHQLISFYILTLLLSIPLLTLHFVLPSVGKYAVSFTQLAPALAVVVLSIILKDRIILSAIRKHFAINRSMAKWLLPAIVLPILSVVVSSLVMTYLNMDYVPWKGDPSLYILSFVAILIGSAAEEIGWRGFLLLNLQKMYSPFTSSIIVGLLWGMWHLNFTGGMLGFILYTVTIIEMSILMTWLYNKSNGNLVLMTIWHLIFNLASRIFLWERFTLQLFLVQSIVFGILCLLVVIVERKTYFLKVEPKEPQTIKVVGF